MASPSREALFQKSLRSWRETAQAYEVAYSELLKEHDHPLTKLCNTDPDFVGVDSVLKTLILKRNIPLRQIEAHLKLLLDN